MVEKAAKLIIALFDKTHVSGDHLGADFILLESRGYFVFHVGLDNVTFIFCVSFLITCLKPKETFLREQGLKVVSM